VVKKYKVCLSDAEIERLNKILSTGGAPSKHHKIAKALFMINETGEGLPDFKAQLASGMSDSTLARIRKKYAEGGLDKVFEKPPSTPRMSRRKFDGDKEAQLVVLCCSKAPKGYSDWTLKLLSDKVVELEIVESVSRETIRQTLKKTKLNLGKS
jgi:Homeodomain-like domain